MDKAALLSTSARETAILEHLPQVKLIARRIRERLPGSVCLDDLISAGVIGLISAIDRYDASQGLKLKTYAEFKIRGAILDALRSLDWAPRQQRRRARLIENAIAALEQQHQRIPSEEEVAACLQLTAAEHQEWLDDLHISCVASLEHAPAEEDTGNLVQQIADSDEHSPLRITERGALEHFLADAIENMPHLEKTVVSLYYYRNTLCARSPKSSICTNRESRSSKAKPS